MSATAISRRRIARARAIQARLSRQESMQRQQEVADNDRLQARLHRELGNTTVECAGQESGAMLVARLALAQRLARAATAVAAQHGRLQARATAADVAAQNARRDQDAAEKLLDQAQTAAEAARERMWMMRPRIKGPRL